jgi:hypothetical protein
MLTIRFFTQLDTYKGWIKFSSDCKLDCIRWINSGNKLKIGFNTYTKTELQELKELFRHELVAIKIFKDNVR